jgi:uncharacterized protein with von Willebrand factor type A (vWA) domain
MTQTPQSLLDDSRRTGLSQQSIDLLVENLNGQAGLGCVGAQVDDLNSDEATLLSVIIDASGSMQAVRDGVIDSFNAMTRALHDSKAHDSILMSAWLFDSAPRLLYGYTPIDSVTDLTTRDYNPNGGTALYDAALDGLTGMVAYGQELRNNGIRTRCIIVVMSDGEDGSSRRSAAQVKQVADDLFKQEIYTLAFIGLGDATTFRRVAGEMGFRQVLTVSSSASDIRKAINLVSSSVIRAGSTTGGGFFTP